MGGLTNDTTNSDNITIFDISSGFITGTLDTTICGFGIGVVNINSEDYIIVGGGYTNTKKTTTTDLI